MKKWKNFTVFMFFLVSVLVSTGFASGLSQADFSNVKLEANDVELDENIPRSVRVTDEMEVLIVFDSNVNLSDLQVEAVLRGYDHDDVIEDISDVFEVKAGNRYDAKLVLNLPQRVEQGRYDLKIRFDDRVGVTYAINYPLDIGADRHAVAIKDVIFDPDEKQKANRAILTKVRIKNYGEKDEDGVKVKVSVPELGLSASDYIDEIESGDSVTSSELYMRIPKEAETGNYEVVVSVEYDDGDEVEKERFTYRVIGEDGSAGSSSGTSTTPRTVITVSQETQQATAGVGGVVYPITITNEGSEARTYSVEIEGVDDWGTTRVTPSNLVIVDEGETKSLYVYVSAKDSASAGDYMFSATVKSDDTVLKQIPLKTSVSAAAQSSSRLLSRATLKKALEVGLITFVVLLVILGLIIGFNKLRGEEVEEPEEGSEKYY